MPWNRKSEEWLLPLAETWQEAVGRLPASKARRHGGGCWRLSTAVTQAAELTIAVVKADAAELYELDLEAKVAMQLPLH